MEPNDAVERGPDMQMMPPHVAPLAGGPPSPPDDPSVDDIEVVDARTGSFEDFYQRARPSIARGLALALGDVDLAADATDEAMARAYERWPTVVRLERPEGWVYRVGMNWALSVLRRRRRSDHRLYDPKESSVAIADPDVHAALGELDVKHRTVIVCRHLLGWSVAETAAALKVREGTVKSRLHRATRILQTRLRHLNNEEQQ
jgi:RNA polymerase sigma-70 factor (ECF subfamily)